MKNEINSDLLGGNLVTPTSVVLLRIFFKLLVIVPILTGVIFIGVGLVRLIFSKKDKVKIKRAKKKIIFGFIWILAGVLIFIIEAIIAQWIYIGYFRVITY